MKRFLYTAIICEFCCGSVLGSLATLQNLEKPNFQKQDKVQQIYDINLKDFFKTEVYKQKHQIDNNCVALVVEQLIERGDIALADPGKNSVSLHGSAVAALKDELYKLINCTSFQIVINKVRCKFDTAFSRCKDEPLQDRHFEYMLPKKNATFGEIIEESFKQLSWGLYDASWVFFYIDDELRFIKSLLFGGFIIPSAKIFSKLAASAESVMGREKFSKDGFLRRISDIIDESFDATFMASKTNAILENFKGNVNFIFRKILLKDATLLKADPLSHIVDYVISVKTGGLLDHIYLAWYREAVFLWLGRMVVYEVLNGNDGKSLASDDWLEKMISMGINSRDSRDICYSNIDAIKFRKLFFSLIDMEKMHADMPDETKLKKTISDWSKNEFLPCRFIDATKQKDLIFELKKIICSWNEWVDRNADLIHKTNAKELIRLWAEYHIEDNTDTKLIDNTEEYNLENDETESEELDPRTDMLFLELNELTFGLRTLIFSWIGAENTQNNEYEIIEKAKKLYRFNSIFDFIIDLKKYELMHQDDVDEEVVHVNVKATLDRTRKRLSDFYAEQNKLYEEDLKNESKSDPKSWRRTFELLVKDAWESIKEKVLEINNNACAAEK